LPESDRYGIDSDGHGIAENWKQKAKGLKADVIALYYAYRDPRVPWYAKLFIILVVGYALSPIDLIPDFVPVLGYLDDLILIPLGVALALKMLPMTVMEEARLKAKQFEEKPKNWIAGVVIIVIWVMVLAWFITTILS